MHDRLRRRLSAGGAVLACLWLVLAPHDAAAQRGSGTIAGTIRDASGLVLPGVTVEAASPMLIEKARTFVSDGAGQFKLIDLRPGIYTVTFTLSGFATVRRENVEVTTGAAAIVNVELPIGDIAETLVVSGTGATVDIQNVSQQRVLGRSFLDAVPSGKLYTNLGVLIPGVVTSGGVSSQDVGGSTGMNLVSLAIHGGRTADMQVQIDGMGVGTLTQGSNFTYMIPQDGSIQEYAIETSAHTAESETGGVRINIIPKEGGNTLSGAVSGNFANGNLQSSNLSDDLRARGLRAPNRVKRLWDINPSVGGPITRDRLWLYTSWRSTMTEKYVGGLYYNATPASLFYTPDLDRQAVDDQPGWGANVRLTWQASARNKLNAYYDHNYVRSGHNFITPTRSPEASWLTEFHNKAPQLAWTSTLTNRLLVEAGAAAYHVFQPRTPAEGFFGPPIVEGATGLNYRAPQVRADSSYGDGTHATRNLRAAMTYVLGGHALRVGMSAKWADFEENLRGIDDVSYRLLNGVPNAVTYYATPFSVLTRIDPNLGVFAQEQWTLGRLTLNAGVRFDYLHTSVPDQHLPAGTYVPAREFAAADVLGWKDLSPRLGAAFDLLGNGRTAIKFSLNRYINQEALEITRAANPVSASLNTANRSWSDLNGDLIPQENELGPLSNVNFGKNVSTLRYDPDWTTGFGVRAYNWESSVGIQHTLRQGVSASAAYFHRRFGNFQVTDNLLVDAPDFDPYCIVTPLDGRLPGGGGQQACGLFDVKPEKFGLVDNFASSSSNYGTQREQWHGMDLTLAARMDRAFVQGGISSGKTTADRCDIVTRVSGPVGPTGGAAAFNPSTRFCRTETPFETQLKLVGAYQLLWELQISAAFQSIQGNQIAANYVATNAVVRPSLGRNLSGGANATVSINLIEPGTLYGDRVNQLDFRFAKGLRVARVRLQALVDIFNVLNAHPVLAYNSSYGTNGVGWLVPQTILSARLVKVGGHITF